ncbi:hypothetical protein F2Q70_00005787 [Brassica cretica]|uniref:Uncharacterized protein n=1 Tax=Brassica cretica TaxID=69181 RepID=A0A8S9IW62_BRACR|nr:hypothetical protein F2Q68_00022322 [Brassica cretica]KAF2573633.1 hypothetical protein F2Q70_00005787 [Brassica cretica]
MSSSFSFPRPTTTADDLEDLYKTYGVDCAVVLDLASATETPETVREGYCGAYLSFFHSCGHIFPVPELILEILAELGLSLTHILPNFLRYLVAFLVRAREEGRHVIEDIPYHDEKWREQFFVFKVDRASMAPSGSSSMSDGIRGLIGILRGAGGSEDEAEHSQEVIATPFVQVQSSDRLTKQLVRRSSFRASGSASRGRTSGKSPLISIHDSDDENASGERRSPISLSPGSEDETITATRKRRRSSKGALSGPSRPRFVPEGDGFLFAAQRDLISLAGRMRYAGWWLPSLASSAEKEAYAKVAVASSKVMEAFNEYVVVMEDYVVASWNDKEIESIGFEIRRLSKELEVVAQKAKIAALEVERDRDIHCDSRIARRDIEQRYREILESLKDRWTSKKKEVSAEIQLQEVTANIDLLNELKDGGLAVDAELARLKEMEGDCEDLVASAAVPDWSISELDLPQISEDSGNQVGGSSVPDDTVSN